MKKRILMMMTVVMMGACLVVGCSDDKDEQSGSQETQQSQEQESEMTGTLDEVKDFMFVITDETGVSYAFAFEQKPQGLEKLSLGDKIVVTYTGTVSVVDAFLGEIISVEKVL